MKKFLHDMGWYKNTTRQKKNLLAFGFFASMAVSFYWSWLAIPFGLAAYHFYKRSDYIVEE